MKHWIYILAAILSITSCRVITYPGSVDYTDAGMAPAPILVSVGSYDTATKSDGAIDTEEFWKWKDSKVYVYAFNRNCIGFDACTTGDGLDCILDGASDGCGNAGRKAGVSDTGEYLIWETEDETLMYPAGDEAHDFYAYYIDDCEVRNEDIVRSKYSVTMPVTINGAQDIMTARSSITANRLLDMGFTSAETNILARTSYSSHSANLGVHPELFFKHHLVRLSFEAYPGVLKGSEICIQEIAVDSRTKGVFTALHKDASKEGVVFDSDQEEVPLVLMEKDYKTALKRDTYQVQWAEGDENRPIYERAGISVGGSLMLAPAESYNCRMLVRSKRADNLEYEFEIRNTSGGFQPGNHYTVRLAMYGETEIIPEVTVEEWKDGGDYEMDIK